MELAIIISIASLSLIIAGISYSIIKWKREIMSKRLSEE